ncbi:MAG TPA: universal stress protein [Acidimicrobiales bacterium]|jgi:nucleotide-binding universal stress UspA family protein|nr:universal stress protein [Acidimicrobiales bacterium]
MFDVIVVGANDSETARRAVEAAVGIAKMSGGTLHIVSAFEAKSVPRGDLPPELGVLNNEGDIDALLQELSFVARSEGVEPVLHKAAPPAADSLIRYAEEVHADLVVVGNRGMKGVRRLLGSVPNTVAHGAPCSVAIIDTSV